MSGGFLSNFAYGFAQTAKPILEERAKYQAAADAAIREKIASVDPEAELYRRNNDVKVAGEIQAKKVEMQQAMDALNKVNQNPDLATPNSDLGQPIAPPNPTITTPTEDAPKSFFDMTDGKTPVAEPDHLAHYQHADHQAQILETQAGVIPALKGAAMAKRSEANEALRMDTETKKDKEKLNLAAHQTSSDIIKGVDENLRNATLPSQYQTDSVTGKPLTFVNPEDQVKEKEIAGTIHAPLTTAQMRAQGLSKDNAAIIYETLQPTKDIVALKDPNTPWEAKVTAWDNLKGYLIKTYGSNAYKAMTSNENLSPIFRDPNLMDTIVRAEYKIPPKVSQGANNLTPAAVKGAVSSPEALKQDTGDDNWLNQLAPDDTNATPNPTSATPGWSITPVKK